ncbi:hypothetical protein BIV57_08625 [Mangrovactinospora gilvigrisea]|uniref:Endonuclease/exonuclease/phosphatase domain-containing protein n=1 Tax=Mangrovactinospora gilvigrisea TaxID=1428644 RepID=A0A1J7BGX7_9ACTN|nr:endonuclease/exonuclease/phosphatase family protein [Mangrovactinospora gilvigrisea]OIV37910.1 hypothetical protein BIV57_08625 [Mangrovactinospora gilvigrisea]
MSKILTVMTFNIHQAVGVDDNARDLERIADVIRQEEPDAVALQEVAVVDGKDQADRLALLLGGMQVASGHRDCRYNVGRDHPVLPFGISVLTRERIAGHSLHELTSESRNPREVLRVDLPGLSIFAVHPTAGDAAVRAAQTAEAAHLAELAPHSSVLLGDLNSTPDAEPIEALAKEFAFDAADEPTWYPMPSAKDLRKGRNPGPGMRLDYIVPVRAAEVSETRIVPTRASDHYAVVAKVRTDVPKDMGY